MARIIESIGASYFPTTGFANTSGKHNAPASDPTPNGTYPFIRGQSHARFWINTFLHDLITSRKWIEIRHAMSSFILEKPTVDFEQAAQNFPFGACSFEVTE